MMLLTLAASIPLSAQRVGFKTNALYWLTGTANAGVELRMSRHYTLNLEAAVNPLKFGDYKLHLASFTPEVRYWFSARPGAGHFVGIMAGATAYDIRLKDTFYYGSAIYAGPTYGYGIVLGRRWNVEGTIGLGLMHVNEKKYGINELAPVGANHKSTKPFPLKAGITFTYILR